MRKERTAMTQIEITDDLMRGILCAPEATDSIGDIDFDDSEEDFDPEEERRFVEGYIAVWVKNQSAGTYEKRE
jgi:hypothetical protein